MALIVRAPQVKVAAGHLFTRWIGIRYPTVCQATGAASVPNISKATNREFESSVPSSPSTLNGIEQDRAAFNTFQSHSHSIMMKSHWKMSYSLEDSFWRSKFPSVVFRQTRGLKTKDHEEGGNSGAKDIDRNEPKIPVSDSESESEGRKMSLPNYDGVRHPGLAALFSSMSVSEEERRDIKVAFADGFLARASMTERFRNTEDSLSKTQAFFEGYEYHSAATTNRNIFKEQVKFSPATWKLIGIFAAVCGLSLVVYLSVNTGWKSLIQKTFSESSPVLGIVGYQMNVTFGDVGGLANVKEELNNFVNFLNTPSKYMELGARLPTGCLLVGQSGVGKTLLAQAVAGEAGVPLFQVSGAEFDERGAGVTNVRDFFHVAKANAPCVIFIDEIDAMGSRSSTSESTSQTVSQLLTELDSVGGNSGVIVLGATNQASKLDLALVRPGRFDVVITVPTPDLNERKEIAQLYLSKIATDGKVDAHTVAVAAAGFTGAHIYNMCNRAAIKAAKEGEAVVTMQHIDNSIDWIFKDLPKRTLPNAKTYKLSAFRQAGHCLVSYYSKTADRFQIRRISILSTSSSPYGSTTLTALKGLADQWTKEEYLDAIDFRLAGRASEELTFGAEKVTNHHTKNLQSATEYATDMVHQLGFSEKVGVRYHGGQYAISEKLLREMDQEVSRIIQEAYERVKYLLRSKRKELNLIAGALLVYGELTADEVKIVIEGGKLNKKLPSPTRSASS